MGWYYFINNEVSVLFNPNLFVDDFLKKESILEYWIPLLCVTSSASVTRNCSFINPSRWLLQWRRSCMLRIIDHDV